jgi:hypothetical protein
MGFLRRHAWRIQRLGLLTLALAIGGDAQPALRLKTRSVVADEAVHRENGFGRTTKRRDLTRRHWVVQFPNLPDPAQLARLRERGVSILGYIPDFGLSVSAPDNFDFKGLGLRSVAAVAADSKVSVELSGARRKTSQFVLVEFYPDVELSEARSMILDQHMDLRENPDLLANQLLASGTSEQIMALGLWEEVAYIFPASDELIQGLPLHACAGALTDQGPVGQFVLHVGEGWDGPGINGADLNYAFVNSTPKLRAEAVKTEVARAFAEWAKHAKLTFTQIESTSAARTIAVLFATRNHGDAYPFDGRGGILAHTFYPYPVNPEPLAGDIHLDADENWNINADVDLFSVALHEAGHALGLAHSDKPGTVMYPYYRQSYALAPDDITALLTMYAAQDGSSASINPVTLAINEATLTTAEASTTLHGSVSGGVGAIAVSWTSNRGFSGHAAGSPNWSAGPIALGIGINILTVFAKDSQDTQVARTVTIVRQAATLAPQAPGPQLNITAPALAGIYISSSASVTVSGTASDTSGIVRVNWSNARGGAGQALGTATWSTGPIALQAGLNLITVTAVVQNGAAVSKTLQISYLGSAAGSTSPPTLSVTSPSLTTISTSASSLSVNGTARDSVGIASVTWTNSVGGSGTASGTNNWSIAAIPLLVGTNTITVRAANVAGVTAWRSLVVTRR